MSEIDLAVLAVSEKDRIEAKSPTPMQEIETALKECAFGMFHVRLLLTSFFAVQCNIYTSNTIPYILPNAECDLNMNLYQKGVLNAAPFVGMLFSSLLGGFLTDTFGRKIFLVGGFGGIAFFTVISALSQTFEMLLVSKFFEGLLFASSHASCTTYTSEFCHKGIRDRMMLFQSSYQAVGQILLALLSWSILVQDWEVSLFDGRFALHVWNFYLLIISLFSLTACMMYAFLPESPKFLVTQNKFDEARDVLVRVYQTNTGKPADTFKYINLWKDKKTDDAMQFEAKTTFKSQLVAGLHNVKPMFRKPLLKYLVLICSMVGLIMLPFNVIRLWFPQISTIVEHYGTAHNGTTGLCVMLDQYTDTQRHKTYNTTVSDVCIPAKSGTETYVNSVILGLICVVPFALSGVLVNKLGKRTLLTTSGVITTGGLLWVRWASAKYEIVGLFAINLAICQTMVSLLQTTAVEIFPTTSRSLSIAMMMLCGRIMTLFGNVMFPILLNVGCIVPFYALTGIMCCVTLLTFFVPTKKPT